MVSIEEVFQAAQPPSRRAPLLSCTAEAWILCSSRTEWARQDLFNMQKTKVGGRGKPCSSVKLETVKGRKSAKERATAGEKKVVLVNVEKVDVASPGGSGLVDF